MTRPTTGQLQPLKDTEPDNPKPSAALPRVASLTNERQEKKCKGRHRTAAGPRVRGSAGGIGVSASAPRTARNQTEPMQRITTASRSLPPCRAVVAGPALRDTDTRDAPPVRHGFSFSHSARGHRHRLAALASRIWPGGGEGESVRIATWPPLSHACRRVLAVPSSSVAAHRLGSRPAHPGARPSVRCPPCGATRGAADIGEGGLFGHRRRRTRAHGSRVRRRSRVAPQLTRARCWLVASCSAPVGSARLSARSRLLRGGRSHRLATPGYMIPLRNCDGSLD